MHGSFARFAVYPEQRRPVNLPQAPADFKCARRGPPQKAAVEARERGKCCKSAAGKALKGTLAE